MKRKYISSRRNQRSKSCSKWQFQYKGSYTMGNCVNKYKRLFYVGKKKFRGRWRTYWVEAVGIL
jgi:hypothetical protein